MMPLTMPTQDAQVGEKRRSCCTGNSRIAVEVFSKCPKCALNWSGVIARI